MAVTFLCQFSFQGIDCNCSLNHLKLKIVQEGSELRFTFSTYFVLFSGLDIHSSENVVSERWLFVFV